MLTPTNMTATQIDWLARMRANLETLHSQWYGWDGNERVFGGMNQELFAETDRKIREATRRMNVEVEDAGNVAGDNEGWDGELNADLVVLGMALDAIIAAHNKRADYAIKISQGAKVWGTGRYGLDRNRRR